MRTLTIFAYGTLITGARSSAIRALLDACLIRRREGWIRGRLYDLGPYPGLVAAPRRRERVRGEVLELRSPGRCLGPLDEYEDYDVRQPHTSPYRRVWSRVGLQGGGDVWAWVYWYQGHRHRAHHIPNGDWRHWIGQGG